MYVTWMLNVRAKIGLHNIGKWYILYAIKETAMIDGDVFETGDVSICSNQQNIYRRKAR